MIRTLSIAALAFGLVSAAPAHAQSDAGERDLLDGLQHRLIGPYKGGRATAASGWAGDADLFYIGVVGGLWKTENAGVTWSAVGDDTFATGPIGAVAVAPSDPNVIWAGTGESPFRGVASAQGDGVYRSTDAGRSWSRLGLEETRQISSIVVHPDDPDTAWVAAQGDAWEPTQARGVYLTRDGGASWRKVLEGENRSTGAVDLQMDPNNPRILYASLWEHDREPWMVRSGGPGSGLWRSMDGGESWTELTAGLPEEMGKIGVSPSGGRSGVVYAVVEAVDEGGLYRSDDYGDSWRLVNGERRVQARSWYYMHIKADPADADVVYVLNSPLLRSIDGGRTFTELRAPHVDHHDLWINPNDPDIIISANDGGGAVSRDAGLTWSSINNQPTGQFYRINADNMFPYRIYAGQQDSSTLRINSRSPDGTIGGDDFQAVGGCESGHNAFDPDNPRFVYSGCFLGGIDEFDSEKNVQRGVSAYPELRFGVAPSERRHRWNWNAPILVSRHDPSVIYHAGESVWRSENRGFDWTRISPDLSRDDPATQGPGGGPITNEVSENYNTVLALAESPSDPAMLWAGTDDGRVHVTRDGGESWREVTPRGVDRGMINTIEISEHDPERVYLSVARYKLGDDRPYIFVTENGGERWRRIDDGLPSNAFVRVVREDPERAGLLFAGTERALHVSFDAGRNWRSLQLNLPAIPITDLKVHQGDLIVSTQGRAIWALDDISPLRALDPGAEGDRLLPPAPGLRFETVTNEPAGPARNPPAGAYIHYVLETAIDLQSETLALEIYREGELIRTLKSNAATGPDGGGEPTSYALPAHAGLNRAIWSLDVDPITEMPGVFEFGGGPDGIIQGYTVAPGDYTIRLLRGEALIGEAPLQVRWDPRLDTDPAAMAEQQRLVRDGYEMIDELHRLVNAVTELERRIEARAEAAGETPDAAEALLERIRDWRGSVISEEPEFFQDVLNWPDRLDSDLIVLTGGLNAATQGVTSGLRARHADLSAEFDDAARRGRALLEEARNGAAGFEDGTAILVPDPDAP